MVFISFFRSQPLLTVLDSNYYNAKKKKKKDRAYLLNLMEERMCSGPWSLAVCDTWRHYNNTS